MAIEKRANSQDFMVAEALVCANTYHPVPVVVARARDCLIWDVEGREDLDMGRVAELVNGRHALASKAAIGEDAGVARESLGVAGYGHDALDPARRDLARLRRRAGARRIEQHGVEARKFSGIERMLEEVAHDRLDAARRGAPQRRDRGDVAVGGEDGMIAREPQL